MQNKLIIKTEHNSSEKISKSIQPENTEDIKTKAKEEKIITSIQRQNINSLKHTADDYMKNIIVANKIIE